MLNYMKSEWYRITHSPTMYVFTGIMACLSFLLNIILWVLNKYEPGFPYGTVAFSLSNLTANLSILCFVGGILVSLLLSGERRNGVLKNSIAFGISREEIFVGKCIISAVVSVCSLIVILIAYVGSAVLLLEPGIEPDAVGITLRGIACVLAIAVASEILLIAFYSFLEKEAIAATAWYLIVAGLPRIFAIIGLKSEICRRIAAWMPYNFLGSEVQVNMSGWNCLWETPEGVAKCLISGMAGVIVFLIFGLAISKKQEV